MRSNALTSLERKRSKAIVHIVHEYANFVSSAEMVLTGRNTDGTLIKPPVNTHISHAFYLNCRKLADFFLNRKQSDDDILAEHYVEGFKIDLPKFDTLRQAMNKQLAHMTYHRDVNPRMISHNDCKALYAELRKAWGNFRKQLAGSLYEAEFSEQITRRKVPHVAGTPSEFENYDLD
jgi:hypothetical protein